MSGSDCALASLSALALQALERTDSLQALELIGQGLSAAPLSGEPLAPLAKLLAPEQQGFWKTLDAEPLERLIGSLIRWTQGLRYALNPSDARYGAVQEACRLVLSLHALVPPTGELTDLGAMLLLRVRRLEEAEGLGRLNFERRPSYGSAMRLASIHREQGAPELALSDYRQALGFAPQDVAVRLDMADLLLGQGRLEEAKVLYQEVLEQEPQHSWAAPSVLYLEALKEEHSGARDQLARLAKAESKLGRASALLEALERCPFLNILPAPTDRGARALARHFEALRTQGALGQGQENPQLWRLRSPHWEAPSLSVAFALGMRQHGISARLLFSPVAKGQKLGLGGSELGLWKLSEGQLRPALSAPGPKVTQATARLAKSRFDMASWERAAQAEARQLKVRDIDGLLASMLYPPSPEANLSPMLWLQRVQLAAALTIAQLERGWQRSARRKALLLVARGPADWSVSAAIIALTRVALADAEARKEIESVFEQLWNASPEQGSCYEYALASCWLLLPQLPQNRWRTLWRRKSQLERGEPRAQGSELVSVDKISHA